MRLLAPLLAAALASLALAAGTRADGPASPFLWPQLGWKGVLAPDGKTRYVALPARGSTVLGAVRTAGGRVERWTALRGAYGVPVVAWDGTTEGLSRNGRTLVLAPLPPMAGAHTRFAVLATRTLKLRFLVTLPGLWAYDALSPDGRRLYLVEHFERKGLYGRYRVRSYDLAARRLDPRVVVDRREAEAVMRGAPMARAWSADGRWAFTLYTRLRHEPFVHALDTLRGRAVCIDLPLELERTEQWRLRLRVSPDGRSLAVRLGAGELARIDLERLALVRA